MRRTQTNGTLLAGALVVVSACDLIGGARWDGTSTLICGGNQQVTIEDKQVETSASPAFTVGGSCKLTIRNSTITAPVVISGGGNAKVVLEGGKIVGSETAIDVGGNAVVQVKGTTIEGAIDRGGSARVEGLPADDPRMAGQLPADQEAAVRRYQSQLCDGLVDCYAEAGEFGQITSNVVATVDPSGKITEAAYTTGTASDAVKQCMLTKIRSHSLGDYTLGPANFGCMVSGTYTRGTQMLAQDASFEKR